MFRNILMFATAIAFAAPIALTQPASARPLSIQTDPAEWCWGCDGHGGGHSGGGSGGGVQILALQICFQALLINIDREVDSCQVLSGAACEERCTPEAVAESCALEFAADASPRSLAACGAERIDECRDLCNSGGAGFCDLSRSGGGDNIFVFLNQECQNLIGF